MKTGNLQQQKPGRDLRKRRKILIVLLALGLGLVAVLIGVYRRETGPIYNGKHLSEWMEIYALSQDSTQLSTERRESAESIHHIGSNAVPLLLDWVHYETPGWRKAAMSYRGNLPMGVREWLINDRGDERAQMAFDAFQLLGDQAASAIPELARRVSLTNSVVKRRRNFWALSYLGPGAVPTVTTIVSNPEAAENYTMFGFIANMGTNARPFVPLFVKHLQHTNYAVAMYSARVLGELGLEPELVVPALGSSLSDPIPAIRGTAAQALERFGERARPALPALLPMLRDSNIVVRDMVTKAIREIAPEVLTNAPGNIPLPTR